MKNFFLIILCSLLAGTLMATDIGVRLEKLLPSEVVRTLVEQGRVKKSAYRMPTEKPGLNPDLSITKEALLFWIGDDAPFFSESLYLYKKKPAVQGLQGSDTQKISIILRSLSHLEGLEYYSSSRKKMRTLYEKSYVVASDTNKKRIPDPVEGSADNLSIYALQKDLTFGEYIYNYYYRQGSDTVGFFSRNVEAMSYSFFKVLDPDNLRISLIVHDLGDYLLIYSLTRADFIALPGIEGKLNTSFSTRAEAMYNWFIKEYEKQ